MEDRLSNVEQSLARIEVRAEVLERRLAEVLDKQDRNHQCLARALHGTGDTPGLVVRVDRLEGWHKRTAKTMVMLFTVMLPLVGARLWDALSGGGQG